MMDHILHGNGKGYLHIQALPFLRNLPTSMVFTPASSIIFCCCVIVCGYHYDLIVVFFCFCNVNTVFFILISILNLICRDYSVTSNCFISPYSDPDVSALPVLQAARHFSGKQMQFLSADTLNVFSLFLHRPVQSVR